MSWQDILLDEIECSQKRIEQNMPRIAFFFGISIYMYLGDHGEPHCHGVYGDYAASFSIENGTLLAGMMPPKQESKIKGWILANHEDLMETWNELAN